MTLAPLHCHKASAPSAFIEPATASDHPTGPTPPPLAKRGAKSPKNHTAPSCSAPRTAQKTMYPVSTLPRCRFVAGCAMGTDTISDVT
jgi:hypothetical protein